MFAQETEQGGIRFQDWAIEVMVTGVVNVADGGFDGYIALIPTQENNLH